MYQRHVIEQSLSGSYRDGQLSLLYIPQTIRYCVSNSENLNPWITYAEKSNQSRTNKSHLPLHKRNLVLQSSEIGPDFGETNLYSGTEIVDYFTDGGL